MELHDFAAEATPRVEIGARVVREARRVAYQKHRRVGSSSGEMARHDQAIAPVVPCPGDDDGAGPSGLAVEQFTHQNVSRATTRVFHQQKSRDAAASRVTFELAHLRA